MDVAVLVLVALAAIRGYVGGLTRQVGQVIGLIAGLLVGADVASGLAAHVTSGRWRAFVALGIVVVAMGLGAALGSWLGALAHRGLQMVRLGLIDRVGGAVVGGLGMLVVLWLVAGLLAPVAWGSVASAIQGSIVLRAVDRVAPPVPAVEARVQSVLRSGDLPTIFASLIAPSTPSPPAHLGAARADVASPPGVLKVLATQGCPIGHEGTGFVVSAHDVVTDAHVVAGAHDVSVGGQRASVVYFDPRADVAILHVSGALPAPLTLGGGTPAVDARATVVGYPQDATRTLSPAVLLGQVRAQGRDIYNQALVQRTLLVLAAHIQPGSSGSPVLEGGSVVGVVVSRSVAEPLLGYATPVGLVRQALASLTGQTAVSTQSCVS